MDNALSYSQLGLWVTEQIHGPHGLVLTTTVEVDAGVPDQAIECALRTVTERHATLRTRFSDRDGTPRQRVSREPTVPLWDSAWGDARDVAFALDRELPWRAIVDRAAERTTITLAAHHLIFDDDSKQLWAAEVEALLNPSGPPLPELAIEYADYVDWQADEWPADGAAELADRWRHRLAPTLPMITNWTAGAARGAAYASLLVDLPDRFFAAVEAATRRSGSSLFAGLCAVVGQLVARETGATRPILGTVVEGRDLPELRHLIGCFTDMALLVPAEDLQFDLAGDADRYAEAVGFLLEHPAPFGWLVDRLKPARHGADHPFTGIGVQLMHGGKALPADRPAEPSRTPRTPFAVEFGFVRTDAPGLRLEVIYRSDQYRRTQIDAAVRTLLQLAEEAVAAPADGAPPPDSGDAEPPSILAVVDRWADTQPQRPAWMAGDQQSDYAGLRRDALAVHDQLAAHGVQPGEHVGVHLDRGPHLLPAMLGVWAAGAVYLPLDRELPVVRKTKMAGRAEVRVILTDATDPHDWPGRHALVLPEKLDPPAAVGPLARDEPVPQAYVMFTSGSSGEPKGVQLPHRALSTVLAAVGRTVGLDPASAVLALTSISFDISLVELLGPLWSGGRTVLAPTQSVPDPAALVGLAARTAVTHIQATPPMWRLLLSDPAASDLPVTALCGGDVLPSDLADQLCRTYVTAVNLYGPTEATIWASVDILRESWEGQVSIGRPLDSAQFDVVDSTGQSLPVGRTGDLWIGGPALSTGYLNDPDQTAERFVVRADGSRWYRTGDRARRGPDGRYWFLGRGDDQLKLRGFRVEPEEIEAVLRRQDDVKDAGVVVEPGLDRLVAFVVPAGAVSLADLLGRLRQELPGYMVPSAVFWAESIPLTASRKVDRRALAASSRTALRADPLPEVAMTDRERQVLAICAEVLETPDLRLSDDFFAVGGHSLLVVRLVTRLWFTFGVKIPLRAIFEAADLRQIDQAIDIALAEQEATPETLSPPPRLVRQPRS